MEGFPDDTGDEEEESEDDGEIERSGIGDVGTAVGPVPGAVPGGVEKGVKAPGSKAGMTDR